MAEKSGVARSLKRPVSTPEKKIIVPPVDPTAKDLNRQLFASKPVLFCSEIILSDKLRAAIDEKWNDCWPANMQRPLVLLDLISYLLFIKKLKEKHLIAGISTQIFNNGGSDNESEPESLKDISAKNLHHLFTDEENLPELLKNYGLTNLQYSLFLKHPLLLAPTPRLLFNMLEIIKMMDAETSDTRAAIFEYLLNKAETQNEHAFESDKAVKLMIELMQPDPKDLVWDPCAGNAALLINAAIYATHKNGKPGNHLDDFFADNFKGIECDLTWLRIGAMNMILHGIEDPKLGAIDDFKNLNLDCCEQPTLILSNLFFDGRDKNAAEEKNASGTGRPEVYFLNLILETLKKEGRAAVIVPEYLLYNNATEIKTLRQHIIDDHQLKAVISLTNKSGSLFSPGILLFSETKSATNDKIWFYKMPDEIKRKENIADDEEIRIAACMKELDEINYIINHWKNETPEKTLIKTEKSYYVSIDEIKSNNYNLCFNEYIKLEHKVQPDSLNKIPALVDQPIKFDSPVKKIRIDFPKLNLTEKIHSYANTFSLIIGKIAVKLNSSVKKLTTNFSKINLTGKTHSYANTFSSIIDKISARLNLSVKKLKIDFSKINLTGKIHSYANTFSSIIDKVNARLNLSVKKLKIDFPKIKVTGYFTSYIKKFSPIIDETKKIKRSFLKINLGAISGFRLKRFPLNFVTLLIIISLVAMGFDYIFFKNNNGNPSIAPKHNSVAGNKSKEAASALISTSSARPRLSPAQIRAIIYDTILTNRFDEQPGYLSNAPADSVNDFSDDEKPGIIVGTLPDKNKEAAIQNTLAGKYIVIDTTFFHDQPYTGAPGKTYLDPLNNDILDPIRDKNGFIYVVNTSPLGNTSKGWINKKDLMLLR